MLGRVEPGASVLLHMFLLFQATRGVPSNRTIDDTKGDLITGVRPVYLPTSPWGDASCKDCAIQPDPGRAFQGTWTAATFHPELMNISIKFGFQGTAVYVFFINANTQVAGVTTRTECDFYIDGAYSSSYQHTPTASTELDYNVLAFSATDLVNSGHTISIVTANKSYSTFLNFDYATYTTDAEATIPSSSPPIPTGLSTPSTFSPSPLPDSPPVPNPSHSSGLLPENTSKKIPSIGVIIGGVVGGIVALGILAALIFWYLSNNSPQGDLFRSGMWIRAPTLGVEGSFRLFGRRRTDPMSRNHSRQPASENRTNRPSSIGSILDNTSLEARGSLTDSYLGDLEDRKSPHIWKPFVPMSTTDPVSGATIPRAPARIPSQRKLDHLIKEAQREMRELKSEVGHRVPATFTAQPHNDAEVLNALTDQIQIMRRRIEMLQTQRSFRARTPSDAPPGYTYDD